MISVQKNIVLVTELGVATLDEKLNPLISRKYPNETKLESYRRILLGDMEETLQDILNESVEKGNKNFFVDDEALKDLIESAGYDCDLLDPAEFTEIKTNRINLIVSSGLASSLEEAESIIKEASMYISESKLRDLSAKPDLQAIESVQALDEVDKAVNIFSSRMIEWYGLHFPELFNLIDDPVLYAKLILNIGSRDKINEETVKQIKVTDKKSEALIIAAEKSKGGDIRQEDVAEITHIADEVIRLNSLRDSLAKHVERTMKNIAPNLTAIAGATIGARLIAKSGGLERLARRPSSTVQLLGAEKALFRSIKTGTPPPKHGLIFQHQAIHSAPIWQRGKVARSLAAKMSIATRIDAYGGKRYRDLEESLKKRLDEINEKYPKPPSPKPRSKFRFQEKPKFERKNSHDRKRRFRK